ncbi:hypothetical protein BDV41DRAFT_402826 [Aspergillus transmontanensis]|uniref:Uncharacterized protein n=1 Tax=Aspergillus transmontanensis TaxID=1034304 RepID=A0A5N6VNL3_9EURO|nr:hypothetical protein BDV41DRAFT_402826 [Aspergillus transmontanensis]
MGSSQKQTMGSSQQIERLILWQVRWPKPSFAMRMYILHQYMSMYESPLMTSRLRQWWSSHSGIPQLLRRDTLPGDHQQHQYAFPEGLPYRPYVLCVACSTPRTVQSPTARNDCTRINRLDSWVQLIRKGSLRYNSATSGIAQTISCRRGWWPRPSMHPTHKAIPKSQWMAHPSRTYHRQ